MNKLIIIGAGGHGKVVADVATKMKIYEEILFIDDKKKGDKVLGHEVIGNYKEIYNYKKTHSFFVAIGNNIIRKKIQEELEINNFSVAKIIHPSVILGSEISIGRGTIVMPGVIINVSTTIGKGCIINTSSSIDHDCVIGDYVHLSPNVSIAGTVEIGTKTWVGIGSSISNNITIGPNVTVGSGSNVIRDIKLKGVYVGNPVTRLEKER